MNLKNKVFRSKLFAVGKRRYKKADGTTIIVTKDIRYTLKDGSSTIHMYSLDDVDHYCSRYGYSPIH